MNNHDYVGERETHDAAFREARRALRPSFEVQRALIGARLRAGLTQKHLAERIGTTQSVISRLEAGTVMPSLMTLHKLAKALSETFIVGSDRVLESQPDWPAHRLADIDLDELLGEVERRQADLEHEALDQLPKPAHRSGRMSAVGSGGSA